MKKLFPGAPDVPQSVANRASRIIEKHLRVHHVSRASDLPEEAKVRLYRDLRFFLEGGQQTPPAGSGGRTFSLRGLLANMWEKIEDFLGACEANRSAGATTVLFWSYSGESARIAAVPWICSQPACDSAT